MLVHTDDQRLLRDSAQAFVADQAPVSALRARRDAGGGQGYDRGFWAGVTAQGWTGILVSEDDGGVDFGLAGAAVLCEAMGRTLAASPFIVSSLMATTALRQAGGAPAANWLPAIAAGTAVVALAVDEGRKHAPTTLVTAAELGSESWGLNGEKSFVPDGARADAFVVAARSDLRSDAEAGISLFLVTARDPGVRIEGLETLDTRDAARLHLEGVRLDADRLIGPPGAGFAILDAALDAGRLGLAAELSGISQEVLDRTLAYVKQRQQFGRPVAAFQAVQHRMAYLYCQIELLRSAVLAAAQAADTNLEAAKPAISAAKAKAEEVAQLAVAEAIQLHGGIGMTDDLDFGFFLQRVRCASEQWGDRHFHADRFARLQGF